MLEAISTDVLVVLAVGNTTGILAVAVQTYRMVRSHDRTLHGDERNEFHSGLIDVVDENEQGVKKNRVEIDTNSERIEALADDDSSDWAQADD